MDIENGFIKDPLISPGGRIYSARGMWELLSALFPNRVDDHTLLCKENKCRRSDDVRANEGKCKS